jgi:hypothetical protein
MTFQTKINITQAPAVEGDFCSSNPRFSALSVPGGFVAGAGGVLIGRFAWADAATGTILLNAGSGAPTGFIHRALEGLNLNYFATPSSTSFMIPQGFGVGELMSGGDFWARNTGAGAAVVGQKAFASNTTGAVSFAAAGGTVAGSTETKWWAMTAGAANELIKISDHALG